MRFQVAIAAFAAGAMALPAHQRLHNKRVMTTTTTVVWEEVTVTAGEVPAATVQEAPVDNKKHHTYPGRPEETTTTTAEAVPTTEAEPTTVYPTTTIVPTTESPEPTVYPTTVYPTTTPEPTTTYSPEPTTYSTTTEEPTTTSGDLPKPTSFEEIVVYHHNIHRRNHTDTPDMTWHAEAAAAAAEIASTCVYKHAGTGYGQNIAAGVTKDNIGQVISDLFYNGEAELFERLDLYGTEPDTSNEAVQFEKWGHFSQMVWKDTLGVGCAVQDCTAQGLANVGSNVPNYFTVCNYYSAGNVGGGYTANIGVPLGLATLTGEAHL